MILIDFLQNFYYINWITGQKGRTEAHDEISEYNRVWILRKNFTKSLKLVFFKTFRQTFKARNKERLKYSEELIIAYILSPKFGSSLLDVEEHIIKYIQYIVFFLREDFFTDSYEKCTKKYALLIKIDVHWCISQSIYWIWLTYKALF